MIPARQSIESPVKPMGIRCKTGVCALLNARNVTQCGVARRASRSGGGTALARLGMTLVEMMVVIVVIAVLFSIMMPAIGRLRQRANHADAEATAAVLRDAIMQYHFEYGVWPIDYDSIPSGDDVVTYISNNHEVFDYMEEENPKGIPFVYIEDYDTDPDTGSIIDPWGEPYEIEFDLRKNRVTVEYNR